MKPRYAAFYPTLQPTAVAKVPTYNETENLRPLCERLFAACKVELRSVEVQVARYGHIGINHPVYQPSSGI